MDISIKCECGHDTFWYFGDYVRCPKCFNEIKETITGRTKIKELWIRRWNNECKWYSNWEHIDKQSMCIFYSIFNNFFANSNALGSSTSPDLINIV